MLRQSGGLADYSALSRECDISRPTVKAHLEAMVDFLVTLDRRPWFAVEAKLSQGPVDPSLRYFRDRLRIPWAFQVALEGGRDTLDDGVRCVPASRFLAALV